MSENGMEIVHAPHAEVQAGSEMFMPLLSVEQAVQRKGMLNEYISRIMREGEDFGRMPGDSREDAKKVLLKAGAEKLCSVFGLVMQFQKETVIEDWTGKDHGGEPLFYYEYRCVLYKNGQAMGEGIGSANSWEAKYRYRWVAEEVLARQIDPEGKLSDADYEAALARHPRRGGKQRKFEPDFAINKRESEGQYGHPAEYWDQFSEAGGAVRVRDRKLGKKSFDGWEVSLDATLYRIPNPDSGDVVNTLQKMGQKRALVAATLVVTNCSDAFTQDVEDFDDHADENGGIGRRKSEPKPEAKIEKKAEPQESPIQIPMELVEVMNAARSANKKPLAEALAFARTRLIEELPANGAEEYSRVLESCGVKKGQLNEKALMSALLQVWVLATRFKEHRLAKAAASPVTVSEPVTLREFDDWQSAPDAEAVAEGEQIIVKGETFKPNKARTAWEPVTK